MEIGNTEQNNSVTQKTENSKKWINSKILKHEIMIISIILLGSFLRATSLYSFIIPNNFAPGGITGLSAMLRHVTGWSSGVFLLIFNLPLIVLSSVFLNKLFAYRTLIASLATSGILMLVDFLEKQGHAAPQYVTSNHILASLAGGILMGLSLALILKCGASTGGVDIIASIIHKYKPHINLNWTILIMDAIVVFASIFVYDNGLDPVMLAFILIFVSSNTSDLIFSGFKSALKYELVTNEPEAVSADIMQKLQRGVTMMPAIGMYKHEERALLVCIVPKRQTSIMQGILRNHPDTFCFVSPTRDVYGGGFSS